MDIRYEAFCLDLVCVCHVSTSFVGWRSNSGNWSNASPDPRHILFHVYIAMYLIPCSVSAVNR